MRFSPDVTMAFTTGFLETKDGRQVTVLKDITKVYSLVAKTAQEEHQYEATVYERRKGQGVQLAFVFKCENKYCIPTVNEKQTLTVCEYDDVQPDVHRVTTSHLFKWIMADQGDWRCLESLKAPGMVLYHSSKGIALKKSTEGTLFRIKYLNNK